MNNLNKLPAYLPGIITAWICIALAGCMHEGKKRGTYVPEVPDYTDSTFWYTERNDTTGHGADVFYIVSTWEYDWTTAEGQTCHYADVYNGQHRANMKKEIERIAAYMGKGNDFYAPYYRHITINGWATCNEDTVDRRFEVAFQDVRHAFETFISRRDPHRPLVLAGFSQGGKAVVELLKTMSDEVYRQLVAAYVLGYKVTPEDTLRSPHIKGARGANDTGVTICYNSVSDVKFIQPVISAPCAFCINPVNWRTDSTPATLHDTISVRVDTTHHVLVLKGYSGKEYAPILGFLNVGDFHSCEPWLYQECLEKNIAERIKAFRKERGE